MREPFNFPPSALPHLTDWFVAAVLFHPRRKDGTLKIPGRRCRKRGKIVHAVLPTAEALRIPEAAYGVSRPWSGGGQMAPSMEYVLQWWQVWRDRQDAKQLPAELLTDEAILARWKDEIQTGKV